VKPMAPIRQQADVASKTKKGNTGRIDDVWAKQEIKKKADEYYRPIERPSRRL
jgi:hypothetical protein